MSRASLRVLRTYINHNKNKRHIRKNYPDFPEIIPNTKEKTK